MFAAMDPGKLIGHVKDSTEFHLPLHTHLKLPEIAGFQITKFMVLEAVVVVTIILVFVPLARR